MSEAEDLLAVHLKELGIEFTQEYRFFQDRRWRLDAYLPAFSVGIEIEGAIYARGRHTRGAGYQSDLEKYNFATMLGIRLLRFSTTDVMSGRAKEFLRIWLKEKAAPEQCNVWWKFTNIRCDFPEGHAGLHSWQVKGEDDPTINGRCCK